LAVRQEVGGAYVIALAFKNVARLCTPVAPRNFNSYGGIWLRPLLFVALYLRYNISVSSTYVIWWFAGLDNGVYVSGIMS
jgi:hypothetical protein